MPININIDEDAIWDSLDHPDNLYPYDFGGGHHILLDPDRNRSGFATWFGVGVGRTDDNAIVLTWFSVIAENVDPCLSAFQRCIEHMKTLPMQDKPFTKVTI